MRNIVQAVLLVGLILLSLPPQAVRAAGWPDNWLGPADNSYVHLRIGVFYYGAVLDDLPAEKDGPSPLPMGGRDSAGRAMPGSLDEWAAELAKLPEQSAAAKQAEFARCMAELEGNAQFYWRNSRFNCAITYENIETELNTVLRSTLLRDNLPYNSPVDFPRYAGYREHYDGLLHICVLYKYNAESGQLERVRGGGGWTWGAALQDKETGTQLCGWSWWNAPPDWHDCGNDWLFCHEFGHQLDSLFHESGHPEHWFNHLARLEANTGPFGEHFDCMSYILRRTPEADWLNLQWGELRSYDDADSDGMPDADGWLSAYGFDTDHDPSTPDSDGDVLGDRDEILAMSGNRIGHGERLHPALAQVSPLNPDSDGDGLPDGYDPLPWLAMPAFIPQHEDSSPAAWLSGPDEEQPRALVSRAPCELALPHAGEAQPFWLRLSYEQDTALIAELAWGSPDGSAPDSELRLVLDLENDGWFNGDDNYRFHLDNTGIAYAAINRASSYTEWPVEDREGVDKSACGFEWVDAPAGYRYACRLRLDKVQLPAFQGKAGERIGVNIGVRDKGQRWFHTFGEPNTFVALELR